ncbi:MAG TPA: hypothetical protein VGA37_01170 [Gemmatimonadales bacterium]
MPAGRFMYSCHLPIPQWKNNWNCALTDQFVRGPRIARPSSITGVQDLTLGLPVRARHPALDAPIGIAAGERYATT